MDTQKKIRQVCNALSYVLIAKNKNYGDSALSPQSVFNKSDGNSLPARIDDKISRIRNADKVRRNDVIDLAGYLILYMIDQGWGDFSDLID